MDIQGKVALVTGGASGIGSAVARDLARRGVKAVALVDQSDRLAEIAVQLDQEAGRKVAHPFLGNVIDEDFRRRVYDQIAETLGLVNICVPAAGITRDALAVRMNKETGRAEIYPLDIFRLVTEVDLIAPVYWSLEMVARHAESRHRLGLKRWNPNEGMQGVIIFIGSISSQGNKGQIAYASSKAGLEGAAATLMKEAMFHGVRCGVIHPGFTDTPMVRALGEDYIEKYILPETQLGRLIRPEEIADAICFMVQNSAVSGELWADAGWHPSPA